MRSSVLACALLLVSGCSFDALNQEAPKASDVEEVIGLVLRIEQTTVFKARLVDQLELTDLEKCPLRKGTELVIDAAPRKVDGKYYYVRIVGRDNPCPFAEGYIYGRHIGYSVSDDSNPPVVTPNPPVGPVEPVEPPPIQPIDPEPVEPPPIQPIDPEPVEPPPIQPIDPEPVEPPPIEPLDPIDPNAPVEPPSRPQQPSGGYTLTAETNTVFKRQPRNAAELQPSDICQVVAGTRLVVTSLPEMQSDGMHYKVTLASRLNCPFQTGFLFGPHVGLQVIGNPSQPNPPPRVPNPPPRVPNPPQGGGAGFRILTEAQKWIGKEFRSGQNAQCMNFVREILSNACSAQFRTLETKKPWDLSLLGAGDSLGKTYANSLASEEFGAKVSDISALKAGDLVFLRNTYGSWAKGVITHIGIATGNGAEYVDRSTSSAPVSKRAFDKDLFVGGLRLKSDLCP